MGQQPAFSHLILPSYLKLRLIMLANELIDRLERLGLLDQEIIEALREQLVQGGTRVTPEAVAAFGRQRSLDSLSSHQTDW